MRQTSSAAITSIPEAAPASALFRRGFVAMLPLWSGAIPFGLAYGIGARDSGLTVLETQLLSLTLFSAAAQISVVSLREIGAGSLEIAATAIALNMHLVLIGAAISRELALSWLRRVVGAWFLTDASYAVALSQGPLRFPTLVGAGISMYIGWNAGTAGGAILGQAVPDPGRLALDFVVPLTFLCVLATMIRTRLAVLVAVLAGTIALIAANLVPLGVAILTGGALASALAAALERPAAGETDGSTGS